MDIESKELEDFIRSACVGIQKGMPDKFMLRDAVEFEVSVVTEKVAGGRVRILIVGASGQYKKEEICKIKFKITKDRKDAWHFG